MGMMKHRNRIVYGIKIRPVRTKTQFQVAPSYGTVFFRTMFGFPMSGKILQK